MAPYWTGPGVFSHKGKDYEHGAELPKLDKDTTARLIKKGLAAEDAPRVGRPSSEVSQLREQVKDLAEKLKAAGDPEELDKLREQVEALTAERDKLADDLAAAGEANAALAAQLADVRKEADAAGPKEDKKK